PHAGRCGRGRLRPSAMSSSPTSFGRAWRCKALHRASVDQPAQQVAGVCVKVASEPVVHPDPALLRFDQACILELAHVVRKGGLAEIEACGEVADTDWRFGLP